MHFVNQNVQNRRVMCRSRTKCARVFGRCCHVASHWLKMASNRLEMSHITNFASGGHIKACWDILETLRNNHVPKRIESSTKTKSELSLRFCPARGHITKIHLQAVIIFDPGDPSLFPACCHYLCLLAYFTFARLLPLLLLASCLYCCSPAAFTSAHSLPLLLLASFA